jgi:purine-binding chemotaxis protein CheW
MPTREILVFEVEDRRYGLPTADVRELVRAVAITPLPNAPALVEGVVDVRGRILPVIDVRARFKLPPRPLDPSDHFIVASAGARGLILRVDRATHLAQVEDAAIESAAARRPGAAYERGVATVDGGLVLIHDVADFLSAAESDALDAAMSVAAS